MSYQVQVKQGLLEGKLRTTFKGKEFYSFEGIPYAEAPVGKLRFQDPQEPKNWTGVKDTKKPGNKCIQTNPYSKNNPIDGAEDCLYLNIYTPVLPAEKIEKLPVLFFVHGGRLLFGYGDYYQPDYFIHNDVILVTFNYRLHILGFLCLNIPEVPGNAGVKDCLMALKWVNNNICSFNGDINNITIFGESAGAGIVAAFLTSKVADGLYSKVISQSGVSVSDLFMVEEDPLKKATHVASILGQDITDPKELYEYLSNIPIEELVFATSIAELSRPPTEINAYFLPVVEKKFQGCQRVIEEYPVLSIREKRINKVPVLVGINSHEGALFLQKDDDGNIILHKDFEEFIPRYSYIDKKSEKAKRIAKKIHQYYFKGRELNEKTKTEYIRFISDAYFDRDIMMFAELLSKSNSEIFAYNFSYSGNMNTRVMAKLGIRGATHGDLIQYQFYRKSKAEKANENDLKMVEFLSDTWCNFIKHSKPTWNNKRSKWLPYTPKRRNILQIDDQPKMCIYNFDNVKFWMNLMEQRPKL